MSFFLALLVFLAQGAEPPQAAAPSRLSGALDLIRQQRYNDAINKLEQLLEAEPGQAKAVGYLGTAHLYGDRDFARAQKLFEESFRAGGGATFWVSHSHEKLTSGEMADYCRGWLHLGKGEVEFAPDNSEHAFRLRDSDIREFKQNRLSRVVFHIQVEKKTYNFRPRSGDEREVWLILALYKKFAR